MCGWLLYFIKWKKKWKMKEIKKMWKIKIESKNTTNKYGNGKLIGVEWIFKEEKTLGRRL